MRARVVYDSNYGNTRTIAELIVSELGGEALLLNVVDVTAADLAGIDLLVVGSPINSWRPTTKIQEFLQGLAPGSLAGVRAAGFDTRIKLFHGDAAGRISQALKKAGATIVADPQGFTVQGTEGPLAADAVDKAKAWAAGIGSALGTTA
ncbi:flavodoxin family protein [Cryobacterium arcticum]|uniref:Flavodoxin n=1 Tax=Cryobacterium arcticum TaxID=670052 RepID=A0A317ZNK8_9MICO|nr:flavodoxin domain-containing protein [Cryobacterium arcticum]PXA68036.1 flavodoxin [Cryobacterium arcticum]